MRTNITSDKYIPINHQRLLKCFVFILTCIRLQTLIYIYLWSCSSLSTSFSVCLSVSLSIYIIYFYISISYRFQKNISQHLSISVLFANSLYQLAMSTCYYLSIYLSYFIHIYLKSITNYVIIITRIHSSRNPDGRMPSLTPLHTQEEKKTCRFIPNTRFPYLNKHLSLK